MTPFPACCPTTTGCLAEELSQIDSAVEEARVAAASRRLGISELRDWQRRALSAWSEGRDCLVLSATGSGKSACFQLPPLISGFTALVVSPLISLMRD